MADSIIRVPKMWTPSYKSGFAHNAAESANPGLWKGLVGAWVPALGVTGGTLKDVSGRGNDGTLSNMDPATDWVIGKYGANIKFSGDTSTNRRIIIGADIKSSAFSYVWVAKVIDGSTAQYMLYDANVTSIISGYVNNTFELYSYQRANSALSIPDALTHCYAYTFDGDKFSRYRDGVLIGSASGVAFPSARILSHFGSGGSASANWTPNELSSFLLSYRAFSPSEISHLHRDPLAPFRPRDRFAFSAGAAPSGIIASGGLSQIMYGTQTGGVGVPQGLQSIESGV